ncbi:MAG: AMP-binding protein [Desulfuromonadaceae bacterium]|nr:AMP-binding protein [Desulfuromonadaceae bacterium]MDD5105001.1 AMP-binding protein [Desulfuromonadaceae bacterium]
MLTPLEPWIHTKIGLPKSTLLTRTALNDYQLERLRATVEHARRRSPFYRQKLDGICGADIERLDDIAKLPFTTPADIQEDDLRFLCVSQGAIERVVTLQSSGTTCAPKRLHFTAQDLELTADFFRQGMSTLVKPGERVLIMMPGELPGSVGDLLTQGLARMDVQGIVHGIVRDEPAAIAEIIAKEIDCLVGLPVQLLGLIRHPDAATIRHGRIKSVLLSADYVPQAIVREIESAWGCPVFNHYGMTEMGLGGVVDCEVRSGGHIREADLYFEIIDPASGRTVPDGERGEVVFTTLTRSGMPLIRYRTGDLSRFIPEPCSCGTVLKRLEWIKGRLAGQTTVGGQYLVSIADLDEALFPLPGLLNFRAEVTQENGIDLLQVTLFTQGGPAEALCRSTRESLENIPALHLAIAGGGLKVVPLVISEQNWLSSGSIKRIIYDRRESTIC